MTACALLRRQAENNAWANLRLYTACAALDASAYEASRTSFFPSIPMTLNHILTVDWYYVDALLEGDLGLGAFSPEIPFDGHGAFAALAKAQRESDLDLIDFTRSLRSPLDLAGKVRMQRQGRVQVESVANVLMHLFAHQLHHRGQVHAMLAGTGVKPPQLDEFFMAEELPLRAAELKVLGLPMV